MSTEGAVVDICRETTPSECALLGGVEVALGGLAPWCMGDLGLGPSMREDLESR